MEIELLSLRGYAARRGVSHEAVRQAILKGRITTVTDDNGKQKINPVLADAEWTRNSDPTTFSHSGPVGAQPDQQTRSKATVLESTAVLKAFQAKTARVEYEELIGNLVRSDEVEAAWISAATIARTKILAIPSKARQRMPDMTPDQYVVLEELCREALQDIANVKS